MKKKKDFNDNKDQQETNDEQMVQETGTQSADTEKMTDQASDYDENNPDQELAEKQEIENNEEKYQLQIKELQDKYIRLMAEFDNFRKRSLKERMELMKSAGEDIIVNILPVMDDFERGLAAMEKSTDIEAVKQGILLIYNKLKDFLLQRGVKEIEALKQEFNVDVHEALAKSPVSEEDQKGKVVDVLQKGYYLNDKVIRYAKVVVGE
jgi:molecular chaperone GrpE